MPFYVYTKLNKFEQLKCAQKSYALNISKISQNEMDDINLKLSELDIDGQGGWNSGQRNLNLRVKKSIKEINGKSI